MFRQFGRGPDDVSLYFANDALQQFVKNASGNAIKNKADFAKLSDDEQAQYIEDFNLSLGKTAKEMARQGEDVAMHGPKDERQLEYGQANVPMMHCKTVGQCQKFDSDDIRFELDRRGFTDGGRSKYTYRPISELSPSQLEELTDVKWDRGDIEGASGEDSGTNLQTQLFDADGTRNSSGAYYKTLADFYDRTTKPELIKLLLGHNKKLAKANRIRGKFDSSLKGARGAFPSESTNPHMYNMKTGLLKEKYSTIDHHGLTAYDIKGDRYRVEWHPFGPNGGGDASWKRDVAEVPKGVARLTGVYELDSRGLPKLAQLSYKDVGKIHLDKKGNVWQVHVARKNKRSKSMAYSNAKLNRDGSPKLVWGKYDASLNKDEKIDMKSKKFVTPLGMYTYDQLMKMPLDNILKMMIVLELADESPNHAKKMMELGVGPFDPTAMHKGRLSGRQQQHMVKGKRKETSSLNFDEKLASEEKFTKVYGLPKCEYPEAANRCYHDSFLSGMCVPDEKMCFKKGLRPKYEEYVNRKYGARAQGLINDSAGASEFVTEKDLRAIYQSVADEA